MESKNVGDTDESMGKPYGGRLHKLEKNTGYHLY